MGVASHVGWIPRMDIETENLAVEKTKVDIIGIFPGFVGDFLEGENLVCSATAGTTTALSVIQFCF